MAQLLRKAQQFENTKELNAIINFYDQWVRLEYNVEKQATIIGFLFI
jgi:hypothetical protein